MDSNIGKQKVTKGNRNPAWHNYSETIRNLNEEYDTTMKPLRSILSTSLEATEKRFDAKLEPILLEKKVAIGRIKEDFTVKADEATKKRDEAIKRARVVLNTELEAVKEAKKEEVVPA
jgi:ribosomal protein L15